MECQHFIDGRYTVSITRQTFAKRSSLNNLPIVRVAEGGDAGVNAAVTAARSAQTVNGQDEHRQAQRNAARHS
jgi:acyl-CoA reductase-like NAD-dependent aldehyde dehydrogenase